MTVNRRFFSRIIFSLALTSLVFFATRTFAADSGPEPLKSADELVATLRARIGAKFVPPEKATFDVLTAEQRDVKAILFKSGADWNDPKSVVWEWDPFKAPELSKEDAEKFRYIDECKPTFDRGCVMLVASGSGAAIIRVSDKKLMFYGFPDGNPHSIELLPDGNVATASSTGGYLALFATSPESFVDGAKSATPIFKKIPLEDAHGIVWDGKRKVLWALGGKEFVGYEYVGTKESPDLKEVFRLQLEGAAIGGHDLYPAPGYDALMTTGLGVSVFDPEMRKFQTVSNMRSVKSLSLDDQGTTLMQRAVEEWWSETIIFGDADSTPVGTYSGARFYKARWFAPNEFWAR